jgi:transaldolase
VQSAADAFRPLYDATDGKDGYVSLEVNPHLAHDTSGTMKEARRLWDALHLPNVFIKVPATSEGLPAIQQLINIDTVTQQLEDEGVDKFNKPFDKLMETLAQRSQREA